MINIQFCKVKDTSFWIYGINAVTKLISSRPVTSALPGQPTMGSADLINPLLSSLMLGMKGSEKAKTPLPSSNGFEQLVDIKVRESEERIMKHIDGRLIQLETKFEKNCEEIIKLLKELNNKWQLSWVRNCERRFN